MRIISHRGNIAGRKPERENSPSYIDEAISMGFDVEVDLRYIDDTFYLGHDDIDYAVELLWLLERQDQLWIHCKNVKAAQALLGSDFNFFCHTQDAYCVVSPDYLWVHDLTSILNDHCIIPLMSIEQLNNFAEMDKVFGVCTDYPYHLQNKREHDYDLIHMLHRHALIQKNASFLRNKVFLEFGVYHGISMLMWYGLYEENNIPTNFIGFDSFQGIPQETEDKNNLSTWNVGAFTTRGVVNPIFAQKDIKLVKGFFSDSLNDDTVSLLAGKKVGLVHIDCDTYSSTKTVWEWLLKHNVLAEGAVVVYDDWGGYLEAGCDEYDIGEAKAHKDIENKYKVHFTDLGKYIVDPKFYEVKVFQYE